MIFFVFWTVVLFLLILLVFQGEIQIAWNALKCCIRGVWSVLECCIPRRRRISLGDISDWRQAIPLDTKIPQVPWAGLTSAGLTTSYFEDLVTPTPCGELEWAYGVLEKAAREEREREEEKRREKLRLICEQKGHVDIDITTWGDGDYCQLLCNRCCEVRKVRRYEDDARI